MYKSGKKKANTKIKIVVPILVKKGSVRYANDTFHQWLGESDDSRLLQAGLKLLLQTNRLSDIPASGKTAEWQATFADMEL
jgi:hypothetical protein